MISDLVGGLPPINVVAQQVGRESLLVSWTDRRPAFGYRVMIGSDSHTVRGSRLNLTIRAGTYLVEVTALSYPVSSEPTIVTVVVRGK